MLDFIFNYLKKNQGLLQGLFRLALNSWPSSWASTIPD